MSWCNAATRIDDDNRRIAFQRGNLNPYGARTLNRLNRAFNDRFKSRW